MYLYLTLYRKPFLEILTGRKNIEYRERKQFWDKKLQKEYNVAVFRNGYNASSPKMYREIVKIVKCEKEWRIYLGKILKVENVESIVQYNSPDDLTKKIKNFNIGNRRSK